jgi:D-glycero-D-manno-heptose 1,7-bisphosphate phosphatase
MKRPAVFFDRDNTLIVSDGYLGDPGKVVLVEGAAEAVARVRQLGYATVVFSNQSGVARGMFGEDSVHAVNGRMDEMLLDANSGAVIDRHEFCPFHPEAMVEAYRQDSALRKPRPGMVLQAAEKLALDLSRSWVVGDAPRDVEAGQAAGCRTILVRDASLPPSPAANSASDVEPNFVVESLREAVAVIARETAGGESARPESAQPEATHSEPAPQGRAPVTVKLQPSAPAAPAAQVQPAPAARTASPAAQAPATRPGPVKPAQVETAATPRPAAVAPAPAPTPAARALPAEPQVTRRAPADAPLSSMEGVEALLEQILMELRRAGEREHTDFSVTRLLAGIVQVIALAVLFFAYFRTGGAQLTTLVTALTLQAFTIALLIMGRQR